MALFFSFFLNLIFLLFPDYSLTSLWNFWLSLFSFLPYTFCTGHCHDRVEKKGNLHEKYRILKDRIKKRKGAGLTQQLFANRLGLKQNTIAVYEMGKSGISDAVINSICREFNINESWLRTGTGEMYNIQTDDYTNISVDIDKNDPKARQAIIDYWNLSEEDKVLFWKFIDRFVKK